jgi:type II secretory pathway component PulF
MDWFLFSWPTLILLGLALRMALRLTYGARGPEPGDPVYVLLMITSWVLLILGVMPAIFGGVLAMFGGIVALLGVIISFIVALLAAATLVQAVIQRRMAQRRSVCRMVALLVEHGGRLESSVLMTGRSMRGIVGRAANRLFKSLEGGAPLGVALTHNSSALPSQAAAYLAAGSSRPARLDALRELSHNDQSELATIWRECVDRVLYLSFVLVIMSVLFWFLMVRASVFQSVFREFDLELPRMTQLAFALSEFVGRYLAAPIFLAFVLMTLAAMVISIFSLCDVPVMGWLSDRLFRGQRKADVLRILALATAHRQPLSDALYRMSRVYPSTGIREQLRSVVDAVADGADWRDALLRFKLVTQGEHGLLRTAEQVGNLPWAMRTIAKRNEKRAVYRLATALQIVYPMAILLLGAFVGFFVISNFVPLVQLINGLT